jgi:BlaI family transcriptional regulator, penicillinase repressor
MIMPKRPPISRGELDVARAVWELGEATVGQVFDALAERKEIDYSTVQTYLRRLESKGYLKTRRQGRNKLYCPRVAAGQVVREAIDDLVERLFDGEPLALWQHLIQERGITPDETRQLRELLEKWEAEHDDR